MMKWIWLLCLASGKGDQKLGAGHLTKLDSKEKDVCTQLVLEFGCGTGKLKLDYRRESMLSKTWRLWVIQVDLTRLGHITRCETEARSDRGVCAEGRISV